MVINLGTYAQSKMDGAEEQTESEVVVDKYSGEEFEIERHSDFITIIPHIITPAGLSLIHI